VKKKSQMHQETLLIWANEYECWTASSVFDVCSAPGGGMTEASHRQRCWSIHPWPCLAQFVRGSLDPKRKPLPFSMEATSCIKSTVSSSYCWGSSP
jgi:hypothetical protein